ncbi:MAG: hypothetical protein QOF21_2249 [Actinomycetota bacterium]
MRVRERVVSLTDAELAEVMRPREVTLVEIEESPGVFVSGGGMAQTYRRVVTVESSESGRHRVRQRVEVESHIPFWGFLFGNALASHLGRVGPNTKAPFWFPPDFVDEEATATLARICTLAFVVGYCIVLLSQIITYAAEEFGADKGAQGIALATVRVDVFLALPLTLLADRHGRRRLVVTGTVVALCLTAVGSLAPNLFALTGAQVAARGVANAVVVTLGVMVAEEMPAGARAWATSLLTIAGVTGAGICLFALPIADAAPGAWRVLFLIPLLFIPLARATGRHLKETRRYTVSAETRTHKPNPWKVLRDHRGRFILLASSGLLFALFGTPASQFQNEFLRNNRGFSGAEISLFVVLTALPGGIGIVVGGRLAERGRRLVGAVAMFAGTAATALMFYSSGVGLYAWSAVGSLIGAAAIPALAVYGAELFPTEARNAANGGIGLASRIGSVIGLVLVGQLSDRIGIPRSLLYVSAGPLLVCVLILAFYPETAHRELEDLNPEDRPPPALPPLPFG